MFLFDKFQLIVQKFRLVHDNRRVARKIIENHASVVDKRRYPHKVSVGRIKFEPADDVVDYVVRSAVRRAVFFDFSDDFVGFVAGDEDVGCRRQRDVSDFFHAFHRLRAEIFYAFDKVVEITYPYRVFACKGIYVQNVAAQ